jgi:hypothetical protein
VLIKYWDKLLGSLQLRSSLLKDNSLKPILLKVYMVPKDVQYHILRKYVGGCRMLYAIAFSQWRTAFPSKIK